MPLEGVFAETNRLLDTGFQHRRQDRNGAPNALAATAVAAQQLHLLMMDVLCGYVDKDE